ncbi:MAG: N-acetylmuramoyl-L-alanine amidase [Chloroflexi bacterium]|nr:N-acetylmuramoyl-L-alanine amidase [Chloroflexota bacterium]
MFVPALSGCRSGGTERITPPQPAPIATPVAAQISVQDSAPTPTPASTPSPTASPSPQPTPTATATSTPEKRSPLVAIDAGHGGPDYLGAVFKDAQGRVLVIEKDINLQVAKLLAGILVSRGYRVLLTRDGDYTLTPFSSPDLNERVGKEQQARVDLANQAGADIIVSIHFNGYDDARLRGTETYYNMARPFAQKNRRLAEAVHAGILASLKTAGYASADRGINSDESIGSRYSQRWSFLLGANPGFARPSQMPGIIGEALFVTNPDEAGLLQDARIMQAVAKGYADGIERYFAQEERAA